MAGPGRSIRPRTAAWYTKERCQDLIDSLAKDGQLEPALARKVVGDPNFDYELIYGMRRRFAAEFTHSKLKVRLTEADDAKAADHAATGEAARR